MSGIAIIGLGLHDEGDISIRGQEEIRRAHYVFLEHYTAVLNIDFDRLERFIEKPVTLADRDFVEGSVDAMINLAKTCRIAFLVVGDPLCATTHSDLIIRARQFGVKTTIVHNASIMNAIACCGLQLYKFGETVSIPFFDKSWKPMSFYDKIKGNADRGLHTLCLLDIKVKEQTIENLMKGNKIYEPPRYMSVSTAVGQLLEAEDCRKLGVCNDNTLVIGVARIGSDSQMIKAGTLVEVSQVDFGPPLHSLVICAPEQHAMEVKYYESF